MAVRISSPRSSAFMFLALVSILVLLITAKRLDWAARDVSTLAMGGMDSHHPNAVILQTAEAASTPSETMGTKIALEPPDASDTASAAHALPEAGAGLPLGPWTQGSGKSIAQTALAPVRDPACTDFPDTTGILLVMKTGATEAFEKIPVQLMTALRCLPDFLIFSDLDQQIGGHHIRDSLDTVLPEAKHGNPDFDLYRAQQACAVDQQACAKAFQASKDDDGGAQAAGWDLDKYKNIHMAEKSYRLRPNHDWYVFVDADTYVSWPNMVAALGRMNPARARFLGLPTVIGPYTFAHGGSGYVLSRGALGRFAGANPGVANRYDVDMRNHCCGDYMFARAVKDTSGINVEGFWPLSNGEKPYTVPLGKNHWCHPVGMMHHMNSEEISAFWEFERRRYRTNKTPLLFSDVFDEFVASKISVRRDDWDNGADEWFYLDTKAHAHEWEDWRIDRAKKRDDMSELEKLAHRDFESCNRACLHHEDCFQFMWHDGCCAMHSSVRLGRPMRKKQDEDDKMRFLSGWNMPKIKKWIEEHNCSDNIEWPEAVELYTNVGGTAT